MTEVLNLAAAEKLIAGAISKARELDVFVSVAVVDRAGHAIQVSRMDDAGWFSPEIATAKAYAAAAFRRDNDDMLRRIGEGRQAFVGAMTPLSRGKMILGQGGCIVEDGGDIVGAIGVSGAPPDQDAMCAQAGIENWQRASSG